MEVAWRMGIRLEQPNQKVQRQIFEQLGGAVEERGLEIRLRTANGGQQRVSLSRQRCQQAEQPLAIWLLGLATDPARQGARCNVRSLLDAFSHEWIIPHFFQECAECFPILLCHALLTCVLHASHRVPDTHCCSALPHCNILAAELQNLFLTSFKTVPPHLFITPTFPPPPCPPQSN